ncbi:MAG: amidohydrolase [Synergistales bacterium]|nr:amidohydrolase [Synergistales bacterium]
MEAKHDADGVLGPKLFEEAEGLAEDLTAWRREFHQFPELAFEERITSSRVAKILSSIPGMQVTHGVEGAPTAVIGVLRGDIPGKALMLRADMDALALEEETGLPFASCMPGVMHACGHDGHIATLLGAAILLAGRAEELQHPVVVVFQPAEEGKGGAKTLVQAGILEEYRIGYALGLHFWPRLEYGALFSRRGPITAISDRFHLEIRGTGSHAATPHLGVDPIIIASHVLLAMQHLTSREISSKDSAVISVGQLEAGEAYNIIPERVHLWGTLRAFDGEIRNYLQKRLEGMVPDVARAFRGVGQVDYIRNYPQVLNDELLTASILEKSDIFFGKDAVHELDIPLLAGEDFAFYSLEVPSCFMLLGTGAEFGLHHPRYTLPEEILPLAAAWEAYLALTVEL